MAKKNKENPKTTILLNFYSDKTTELTIDKELIGRFTPEEFMKMQMELLFKYNKTKIENVKCLIGLLYSIRYC